MQLRVYTSRQFPGEADVAGLGHVGDLPASTLGTRKATMAATLKGRGLRVSWPLDAHWWGVLGQGTLGIASSSHVVNALGQ